jgi:septum formation protein
VLASASVRRRELTSLLGVPWRVLPQDVDEATHLVGDPLVAVLNVALAKARSAVPSLAEDEVGLAADTIVVADDRVLGKPADPAEARSMLLDLRGRAHVVATSVLLVRADGLEWGVVVTTQVAMRAYSEAEVDAYVEREEPFDKAGGYAIQDSAFRPVSRLDGCYLNVVGLPLCAVARGLETLGVKGVTRYGNMAPPCGFCTAGQAVVQIGRDGGVR